MGRPPADGQMPLLSDAVFDELVVESESRRSIPTARDLATEVREFHGWTLDKLEVFANYLKLYRRVAGGGAFIDAFAGTGRGLSSKNGQRFDCDGSSLVAAKSAAFASLDLIEKDPNHVDTLTAAVGELSTRLSKRIRIHHGDCNILIPELLGHGQLDETRPCFAFLDQESTQLDWRTIEILAGWKTYEPPPAESRRPKTCKVELWILFNSHQVIYRLWPKDRARYPESFSPETLDRILGGRDAWWDLWEEDLPASSLVQRFSDRLYGLGYQYVIPQLIRDPIDGRPQYHMIHATDHPSAISLMRWAKRITDGFENVHLPGLDAVGSS